MEYKIHIMIPLFWIASPFYYLIMMFLNSKFQGHILFALASWLVACVWLIAGLCIMHGDTVKRNKHIAESIGFHMTMSSTVAFFAANVIMG